MKSTKKSFVFSLLSVLLCVSMLIGTTFAWFTDTAKSSNNRIVAGNLDVEMYWSESYDGPWHNVEDPAYSVVFGQEKWEPGYTEMRYFKIVNAGKLALKYQLGIEAAGVIGALADVIDVYYFDDAVEINERTELLTHTPIGVLSNVIYGLSSGMVNSPEGTLLPAGSDEDLGVPVGQTFCAIALHMQESAGNEYKNASIGEGFYITLKATQASFESDSFGSEYDDDVSFPQINLPVLATASVATDDSGFTTEQTSINENGEINALVQAGTKLESGTDSVMLAVTLVSQNGNVEATDGTISRTLDVHVSGVAEGNTVPVIVTINNALPINMELDAVALYHKENGVQNQMIQKTSAAAVSGHNEYYYNSTDGSVVMALASFSEILFEANPENIWEGAVAGNPYSDGIGDGTETNPYIILTVSQLAKLAENVNNGTSYEGVYFKLGSNLVINSWDNVKETQLSEYNTNTDAGEGNKNITAKGLSKYNDPAFAQQHKEDGNGTYLTWTPIGDGNHAFSGHFDGNGHTISGLFKLHYDDPMDRNPMGLFGWIHDGSVKNLTVADSFIYTYGGTVGLVSAYASGETTFENISVKDNFVTSYNYPLGGILGMAWQANADEDSSTIDDRITFKNVTIDSSNLLEALWGTYDSAVGGIVGTAYPDTDITFDTVTSWPELSLYNDCCANYQWFAYRYSGMLIGHVRASDRATWLANNVHCTDVVVKYGEWTDQYYCERVELGKGSYNGAHEWKYQRISKDQVLRDGSGNPIGCTGTGHDHSIGKAYTYKGNNYTTVAEDEDHIAVNITFNQLFGGGQGVYGETDVKYAEYCAAQGKPEPGIKVLDADDGFGSISVKLPNTAKYLYRVGNKNAVALGTLFEALGGTNVVSTGVTLSAQKITGVTSVDYTANTSDWTKGTLQFTGTGVVRLILKYRGVETVLNLEVIDAVNATSAEDATSNNVVLLNDVSNASSITISGGYTFYGNGFKLTYTGNGGRLRHEGMSSGYVEINDGTLDNVQIISPLFAKAFLYTNELETENNICGSTNNGTHYAYQLSAVKTTGTATITNSYIYGARNNILADGTLTVDNCVLSNGSLANIHFNSQDGTLNLNDVTTIQYIRTFNYQLQNQSAKTATVIGVGVLIGPASSGITSNPTLNISGYFNQYNWICASYNSINSSSVAQSLINAAVAKTQYQHTYNNTTYVDLGVIYLNNASRTINDSRTNHGYVQNEVSITGANGAVYAPGANSATVELKDSSYEYVPNRQGEFAPHAVFDYTSKNFIQLVDPDENYCYFDSESGKVKVLLKKENSSEKFVYDPMILSVSKCGETYDYTVKMNSVDYTNKTIEFAESGEYVIKYYYTDPYNYDVNLNTYQKNYTKEVRLTIIIIEPESQIYHPAFTYASSWSSYATKQVTIGDNIYIMPDVSATSSVIGSTTVSGQTIYYPIVTVDGKNSSGGNYSSGKIYCFAPAFSAINIKDLDANTGETLYTYNSSTQKWPHGISATTGPGNSSYYGPASTRDPYGAGTGDSYEKYAYNSSNGGLCYTSNEIERNITANKKLVKFHYVGNDGITYYYYIQYNYNAVTYGSCVTAGTLITLADGTQIPVEQLTGEEMLLVWNLETGKYDAAPIMFIDSDPESEYDVINLYFSDGTNVKVISEHGFWDYDLNKYVYLDENAAQYIGHKFAKQNGDALEQVELVDVVIEKEITTAWSPVTFGHLVYFTNGMLSMPGGIEGLFNIFDVDTETMTYDAEKMQNDIATYGLLTLDDYNGMITEDMFYAFNGQYLGIAVGKGLITWDYIQYLAERYAPLCE